LSADDDRKVNQIKDQVFFLIILSIFRIYLFLCG